MLRTRFSTLLKPSLSLRPLTRSFRVTPPEPPLIMYAPTSHFAQLLAIERVEAEHSFTQIKSQLELDPKSNKWVCKMKVSDFKAESGKEPIEKEVEVVGEGETSLDATNDAARKALDSVGIQHQVEGGQEKRKIEDKKHKQEGKHEDKKKK
ncbi:uncharacterized protein JCM6883_002493 [Sporobolomyces salmoneus]|uniref:uncharacterized protein n=1 Tax=Sporobolomyces salmoneus TaxID=183962 RepID=UPI00317FD57C